MKNLFIFTLATNQYNNYLQKQFETIDLLFPNHFKKHYIILSDKKYDINTIKQNIKAIDNIYNVHIFSSVPALLNFNKIQNTYQTLDYLNLLYNDDDIILFIDADTYFLEKNNDYWDRLYDNIINNDFFMTLHPWFKVYNKFNKYNIDIKHVILEGMSSAKSVEFQSYFNITDKSVWCQNSLFGGKVSTIKEISKKLFNMLQNDLHLCPYYSRMPLGPDEAYLNKIINDNLYSNEFNIYIEYLNVILNNKDMFELSENIDCNEKVLNEWDGAFCVQKYDYSHKDERRFPTIEKIITINEYKKIINNAEEKNNPFLTKFNKNIVLTLLNNERRLNVLNQFTKIGIYDYIDIHYTVKKDLNMMNKYYKVKYNDKQYQQYIDHLFNMYTILKTSYDLGYQHICIYEDDIYFSDDIDKVYDVINNIPDDYDIVKFYSDWKNVPGYNYQNDFYIKINKDNYNNTNLISGLMIAYSRKGMKAVLDIIEENSLHEILLKYNKKIINQKYPKGAFSEIFKLLDYDNLNIYDHKYIICWPIND